LNTQSFALVSTFRLCLCFDGGEQANGLLITITVLNSVSNVIFLLKSVLV